MAAKKCDQCHKPTGDVVRADVSLVSGGAVAVLPMRGPTKVFCSISCALAGDSKGA